MVTYENGAILVACPACEDAVFDMGSEKCAVVADGKGGLTAYRVNDRAENFVLPFLALSLYANGEILDPSSEKTVKMVGRMQEITYTIAGEKIVVTVFLERETNGAFFSVRSDGVFTLALDLRAVKEMPSARAATYFQCKDFSLSSSAPMDWSQEDETFYAKDVRELRFLISFAEYPENHKAAFAAFDEMYDRTVAEIKNVAFPAAVTTEEEKAYYTQSYFAALENFKVAGEFRAFAAGTNYTFPLRTYFRDSYFTVLCMLSTHPELVRDEILTLARGVSKEGVCPSAVKSDFSAFWNDHFDSPSLFILELYEYVNRTGDTDVLFEKIGNSTLLETAKRVIAKLVDSADKKTLLLVKDGDHNRRDWADEVNRGGLVTYVEALYVRALRAMSDLLDKAGIHCSKPNYWALSFDAQRNLDLYLFEPELGYYANYFRQCDKDERNLSIDTIFTVLFGIASEERTESVLDNMEKILESGNNPQMEEDFGAMCVYPPYQTPGVAVHKSARPFDYHNGANWPFLTAMYAYAKALHGKEWRDVLLAPFRYNVKRGVYTAVEYFSPYCKTGSCLQAWSSAAAFVYQWVDKKNIFIIEGEEKKYDPFQS